MGMSSTQVRWLILAAGAWLIQSYDIGLISVVLLPFRHLYHLSGSDVGLLAASATVGIVIGVVPSGQLADRFGRKRLLVAALLWYSAFTVGAGWMPSWQWVAALRFAAGLGLGAMFPLPYTLLTELSPGRIRGRVVGMLDAVLSVGYFAAPLIGGWIGASGLATGWRTLFFLGGIGIPYGLVLWRWLPESPRWLMSVGRAAEAQVIWQRSGQPHETVPLGQARRFPLTVVWQRPYWRRTAMVWIAFPTVLFVFYAIMTYMPSILAKEHLNTTIALQFSALIMLASIPGKFFEGWIVEHVGRKAVIVSFALLAAVAALVFPAVHSGPGIILVGMALAFFGIAVDPAMKVYTAEQYPTPIRSTGVGLGEGIARLIGGALAPYIMALVLDHSGVRGSFILVAVSAVMGAVAVAVLGRETLGQPLAETVDVKFAKLPRLR